MQPDSGKKNFIMYSYQIGWLCYRQRVMNSVSLAAAGPSESWEERRPRTLIGQGGKEAKRLQNVIKIERNLDQTGGRSKYERINIE